MSLENAILTHANALLALADALGKALGGNVALQQATAHIAPLEDIKQAAVSADAVQDKAAELAEATGKRATAAKEAKAKDAQANKDAELEQAVQRVEADAAGKGDAEPDLDYVKDVRPTLLAAIKKSGKEKVEAMIKTFGVDKADKVDPAKYGELLAGAQKLAA